MGCEHFFGSVFYAVVQLTSLAEKTELIKTALSYLGNTGNEQALRSFNYAALDREGSKAMFEVGFWRLVPDPLCRRSLFLTGSGLVRGRNGNIRTHIHSPSALLC